jgi:hypothetical protein
MHRGHDALNAFGPHVRDPLGNLNRLGEHFATRNDMIYGAERASFAVIWPPVSASSMALGRPK